MILIVLSMVSQKYFSHFIKQILLFKEKSDIILLTFKKKETELWKRMNF